MTYRRVGLLGVSLGRVATLRRRIALGRVPVRSRVRTMRKSGVWFNEWFAGTGRGKQVPSVEMPDNGPRHEFLSQHTAVAGIPGSRRRAGTG